MFAFLVLGLVSPYEA